MPTLDNFRNRFGFDPTKTLHVGVERECFVTNGSGKPVPRAKQVLDAVHFFDEAPISYDRSRFGYELSACQLEGRTHPCVLNDVLGEVRWMDDVFKRAMCPFDLSQSYDEVGPEDMPLDVYPDPTGRYQEITRNMPEEKLRAACRIIGTHVHVGMPDHDTALRVYDDVLKAVPQLCTLGDSSAGKRLAIYRTVNPDCEPPRFGSWERFHAYAVKNGCADDPRRCWTLLRISIHGSLEFRMFGATDSPERVSGWARECHDLCARSIG